MRHGRRSRDPVVAMPLTLFAFACPGMHAVRTDVFGDGRPNKALHPTAAAFARRPQVNANVRLRNGLKSR